MTPIPMKEVRKVCLDFKQARLHTNRWARRTNWMHILVVEFIEHEVDLILGVTWEEAFRSGPPPIGLFDKGAW